MRDLARKLLGYAGTAGLAAMVDLGGFAALIHLGLPPVFAAVLSFCAAAVVNYLTTSRFVFAHTPSRRRFALFMVAATVGLIVNVSITVALSSAVGVPPVLAKAGGIGSAFLLNFMLNTFVVFRVKEVGRAPSRP